MVEKWKPVKDYEELYEVSNLGNVRSLPRQAGKVFIKGRVLKPFLSRNGYYCVNLSGDGISKTFRIHRLVATAFVPNPERKETVNHKNENKADNRASNLEWLTLRENIHYGTRTERSKRKITETSGVKVIQIASDGHNVIAQYDSVSQAARAVGARATDISAAISKRIKSRNYYWRKLESIEEHELLFWGDTGERVSAPKTHEFPRKTPERIF